MAHLTLRSATDDDHGFLWSMLYEAVYWRPSAARPPRDEGVRDPEVRRYLDGWGRDGDHAIVATADDEPVGASWYRLFTDDEPGYGFVDDTTPEASLAVAPTSRRLGLGRALLSALLVQARLDGFLAVSLSVEDDNPAAALYEQLGFEDVAAEGSARTMINRFALR